MGARSERLALELAPHTLTGAPRALAEEAVKVLERLEVLDEILSGNEAYWTGIVTYIPPTVAELRINAPLAEARQQGQALSRLLAELSRQTGEKVEAPPASRADELAEARQKRKAAQGQ